MVKTNYSVARVVNYTKQNIGKAERHNERKNTNYSNINVDSEQTKNNVYYKTCNTTYNERLKELVDENKISLRGLKDNAKVFDELVLDINSDYFEKHGGYNFAKRFYEEAFHFAKKEYGKDNIISAVMHADEQNIALTAEYGKPIYHYHLHVIAIPVVKKEIKYSKRTKDKSLVGKVKKTIMQVSHSKKWKSQAQQELNEIKKDIDNYKGYKGDIDNIDVGKSKLFGKKVELDTDDYQNLVKYAKKGVVADIEITKLKEENSKLKHDFNELKEKTRDFIRAIAYAPTKVMNFFKSLFKEEEQEKQRQLELAEQQRLEKLYTPSEREILSNITDYDKAYLNRFEGETRERVERGLIEEYEKERRYQEKINSPEYKKRRADRNAR